MWFFPRILENLPTLPRQLPASIGYTKNYQPIGVTVHSHLKVSYSVVGEGGVAVYCEKNPQFFPNTLYIVYNSSWFQVNHTIIYLFINSSVYLNIFLTLLRYSMVVMIFLLPPTDFVSFCFQNFQKGRSSWKS